MQIQFLNLLAVSHREWQETLRLDFRGSSSAWTLKKETRQAIVLLSFLNLNEDSFHHPEAECMADSGPPMPLHAHADTATNTKIPNWYPHMRTIATKDAEVPLGDGLQKLSSLQLNLQLLHVPHKATYLFNIQNTIPCTVMYYYVSSYLTVHFRNHMYILYSCAWQFVFASTALFGETLCCQQWCGRILSIQVPS